MSIHISIIKEENNLASPPDEILHEVAYYTLTQCKQHTAELAISMVNTIAMTQLNQQFRHKNQATNVLAFPCEMPANTFNNVLGDVVLCAPIINDEAQQQRKSTVSHWSHLLIHGTLHLLGYDHQTTADAIVMEQLEIKLLSHWDYPNPYQITTTTQTQEASRDET